MRLLERFRGGTPTQKKKKGSSNYAYAVTRVRVMKSKLLPKESYPRLLNMGIDEITRFIQESEYKNDVDELAMKYSGGDLAEHALNRNLAFTFDKLYYSSLFEAIGKPKSKDRKLLTRFIKLEVDVKNLSNLFRLKKSGVEQSDDIMPLMIEGGLELNTEKLAPLPYGEFVNELQKTHYWNSISGIADQDMDSLINLERRLTRKYLEYTTTFSHASPISIMPVVDYIIHKNNEVTNLRIIYRGKEAGLDENLIKDQLVVI